MMNLTVSFDFEDRDLAYFWDILRRTRTGKNKHSEAKIIANTKKLCAEMKGNISPFVDNKLETLNVFIDMVKEPNWQMPVQEREDILAALIYFNNTEDLIPDGIPCLGFLDDSIMLDLVAESLTYGIKAFKEYCVFRDSEHIRSASKLVTKAHWLADKHHEKHERVRRRNARDHSSVGSFHSIF